MLGTLSIEWLHGDLALVVTYDDGSEVWVGKNFFIGCDPLPEQEESDECPF